MKIVYWFEARKIDQMNRTRAQKYLYGISGLAFRI